MWVLHLQLGYFWHVVAWPVRCYVTCVCQHYCQVVNRSHVILPACPLLQCVLRLRQLGISSNDAFAPDYAFLIRGLIDLYETTFDDHWMEWAIKLQDTSDRLFWDEGRGGYFDNAVGDPSILLRLKEGMLYVPVYAALFCFFLFVPVEMSMLARFLPSQLAYVCVRMRVFLHIVCVRACARVCVFTVFYFAYIVCLPVFFCFEDECDIAFLSGFESGNGRFSIRWYFALLQFRRSHLFSISLIVCVYLCASVCTWVCVCVYVWLWMHVFISLKWSQTMMEQSRLRRPLRALTCID